MKRNRVTAKTDATRKYIGIDQDIRADIMKLEQEISFNLKEIRYDKIWNVLLFIFIYKIASFNCKWYNIHVKLK